MTDGASPQSIWDWLQREWQWQGRLGRREFVLRGIALSFLNAVLGLVGTLILTGGAEFVLLYGLSLLWLPFWLSLVVRRLHDIGLPGWWSVPVFAAFYTLVTAQTHGLASGSAIQWVASAICNAGALILILWPGKRPI